MALDHDYDRQPAHPVKKGKSLHEIRLLNSVFTRLYFTIAGNAAGASEAPRVFMEPAGLQSLEPPPLPRERHVAASLLGQETTAPDWQEFSIAPPTRNHTAFSREGIRAEGVPLKRVIARAYGLPEHRVIGPDWLDTERYALTAIVADPQDFQLLLQEELASRFHMIAERKTKKVAVYLLRPFEGAAPSASAAQTQAKTGPPAPSNRMSHATMAAFAREFADVIHRPVFDESGIDGTLDISFAWTNNSPSLQKAVKEQLGLQISGADSRRRARAIMSFSP